MCAVIFFPFIKTDTRPPSREKKIEKQKEGHESYLEVLYDLELDTGE